MSNNWRCALERPLITSNMIIDESSIMQDEETNGDDISESTITTTDSFSVHNDNSFPIKPPWKFGKVRNTAN